MSINAANFNLITQVLSYFPNLAKVKMLELGNQKILDQSRKPIVAKKYFTNLGIKHVSFDLNGLDGAIPVDLSKEIPQGYLNKFHIIVNTGTSEHVENQDQVFKNMHNACRVKGYIINSVPQFGSWRGHSPYHYTLDFPLKLSIANNYKLIHRESVKRKRGYLVNFIFQKINDSEFIFENSEVYFSENYKRNKDNLF